MKPDSPFVPSAPSKVEQLRMKMWEMPAPTTREQYLERKDLKHEIAVAEKDDFCKTHKAGYQNLMKIRGQMRGENDGM